MLEWKIKGWIFILPFFWLLNVICTHIRFMQTHTYTLALIHTHTRYVCIIHLQLQEQCCERCEERDVCGSVFRRIIFVWVNSISMCFPCITIDADLRFFCYYFHSMNMFMCAFIMWTVLLLCTRKMQETKENKKFC